MREKEKILENKLLIIEKELAFTERVTEEEKVREYTKLKNEIESIKDQRIKALIIRSRTKWIEEGEKSTKYFFCFRKKKLPKKKYF